MSDLISREVVIDVLKQTGIIQDNDLGHLVIDEINRIPTAYDVEKVVAELKKMRNEDSQGCKRVQGWKCHSYSDCGLCIMDRTIDIVRKGETK